MEAGDRNKSALTHVATATAALWLDGLGCKPVETEVQVSPGWVADLASFWSPTMTEAKKSRLLAAMVPDTEYAGSRTCFVRMCRELGSRFTVLVEVKTSRSDFLSDAGRKYGLVRPGNRQDRIAAMDPAAHLQIVAGPRAAFADDRLHHWGRLLLSDDCKTVKSFDGVWSYRPVRHGQVEGVIAAIAIRRDHNTRYASLRRALKSYRAAGGFSPSPDRLREQLREARAEVRLWRAMFPSQLLCDRLRREAAESLDQ